MVGGGVDAVVGGCGGKNTPCGGKTHRHSSVVARGRRAMFVRKTVLQVLPAAQSVVGGVCGGKPPKFDSSDLAGLRDVQSVSPL